MIESFKIKNFKSFRDETEISFLASKKEGSRSNPMAPLWYKEVDGKRILRLVLLYGLNGSGKSNVLDALECLSLITTNKADGKMALIDYSPFWYDEEARNQPVEFWLKYYIGERCYSYHVKYDLDFILEEELRSLSGRTALVYNRSYDIENDKICIVFGRNCGLGVKHKDALVMNSSPCSTTLAVAGSLNTGNKTLNDNFTFFTKLTDASPQRFSNTFNLFATGNAFRDDLKKRFILGLMDRMGFDIVDYHVSEINLESLPFGQEDNTDLKKRLDALRPYHGSNRLRQLLLKHLAGGKEHSTQYFEESNGTLAILQHLAFLYDIVKDGKVAYSDDLGREIHPKLLVFLLKLYIRLADDCQFVAVTNDTSLMGVDFFRRDAVRLVEKGEDGASTVRRRDYLHNTANFMRIYNEEVAPRIDELVKDEDVFDEAKVLLMK